MAVASATVMNINSWSAFKIQFNKHYATDVEEARHHNTFNENAIFHAKHNAEFLQGVHTYTVGVNQFSDLTHAEFKALYTTPYVLTRERNYEVLPEAKDQATSVDW